MNLADIQPEQSRKQKTKFKGENPYEDFKTVCNVFKRPYTSKRL